MKPLPAASGYCPYCGYIGGMVYVPKHRNIVQGRLCKKCNEVNFKPHEGNPLYDHGTSSSRGFETDWKRPSGSLSYDDYGGISN